jgi:Xaa-Pro aminopeptidase
MQKSGSGPVLVALRERLEAAGLAGFLVPRADEHLGEYVPPSAERLAFLTGFTGSAGLAVVLAGEAALFTDGRYPAEAIVLSDALVASWHRDELEALMARYPPIARNVIRIIGARLQEAQNRLRELATQRCERRIAHVLLRLADQASAAAADGMAIGFPLRRKDIAELAGTTLYTASRVLTAWEKAGWLASQGQQLVILQRSALERITEEDGD